MNSAYFKGNIFQISLKFEIDYLSHEFLSKNITLMKLLLGLFIDLNSVSYFLSSFNH